MEPEVDFPRGGAGVLTALEIRDVKHQAKQDVLFKDEGEKQDVTPKKTPKHKKERETPSAKRVVLEEFPSLKKLTVGTLLLCAVREIRDYTVQVSLPFNIPATIHVMDISAPIKNLAHQVAESVDNDEEDDDMTKLPSLDRLFYPGMLLPCSVTSIQGKQVSVSIDPAVVNANITASSIKQGMVLSAWIQSAEDHGYIVSFGLSSNKTGFLLNKNAQQFVKNHNNGKSLKEGQVIPCLVLPGANSRSVPVTVNPDQVYTALVSGADHLLTVNDLVPGLLVNATLKEITTNGLVFTIFGVFEARASIRHLPNDKYTTEGFVVKKKYKARVLWVDRTTVNIGLTLLADVVKGIPQIPSLEIGDIIEKATVVHVESSNALMLDLGDGIRGYAPISLVSEERISKFGKQFAVGRTHPCRVVQFNYIDNAVIVSLQKSVLERPFMTYNDITVGQVVTGTVMHHESYGMLVQLTDYIRGLCPTLHLADSKLKHPGKKLKQGKPVECRVLHVDAAKKRLLLTHKKTLVESSLPLLADYEDAKPGETHHGVVVAVKEFGCLVQFFNNVRGIVRKPELSSQFIPDPASAFTVGQVVQCRVLECDPTNKRLALTLKGDDKVEESSYSPGQITDAVVTAVLPEGLSLELLPSREAAFLPSAHLSDHMELCPFLLDIHREQVEFATATAPYKLSDVMIVCPKLPSRPTLVTKKNSLMKLVEDEDGFALITFSDLQPGMILNGFIKKCLPYGCFVEFVNNLVALAPNKYLKDEFVSDGSTVYKEGQSVRGKVMELDREKQRFLVTLRCSDLQVSKESSSFSDWSKSLLSQFEYYLKERETVLKSLSTLKDKFSDFTPGSCVEGTVLQVKTDHQLILLDLGNDLTGSAYCSNVEEYNEGDKINCCIMEIRQDGTVMVSLSPDLLEVALKQKKKKKKSSTRDSNTFSKQRKLQLAELQSGNAVMVHVELVTSHYIMGTCTLLSGHMIVYGLFDTGQMKTFPVNMKFIKPGALVRATVCSPATLLAGGLIGPPVVMVMREKDKASYTRSRDFLNIKTGDIIDVIVKNVQQLQMDIRAGIMRGRVHITQVLDKPLKDLTESPFSKYGSGDIVKARVIMIRERLVTDLASKSGASTQLLELSIKPSVMAVKGVTDFAYLLNPPLSVGSSIIGFIKMITKAHLVVCLTPSLIGEVPTVLISNDPEVLASPNLYFTIGQCVHCTVVKVNDKQPVLSLIGDCQQPAVGDIVTGQVKKIILEECVLVSFGAGLLGRVDITDASDDYTDDPFGHSTTYSIVKCCVVAMDDGRIDLSLRESHLGEEASDIKDPEITSISDLKVGMTVRGYVKSKTDVGYFIRLGRSVTGRVKIGNITDRYVKDFKSLYRVGALVTAKVIGLTELEQKIELSLRQSDVNSKSKKKARQLRKRSSTNKEEMSDLDLAKKKRKTETLANVAEEESEEEEMVCSSSDSAESSEEEDDEITIQPQHPRLATRVGFNWEMSDSVTVNHSSSDSSDENEALDENVEVSTRKRTKRQKRADKLAEEKRLFQTEQALLDVDRAPQGPEDFDRLLMNSPNDSLLWMHYMAFYIHTTEIDKARAIGQRALQTISFREEKEKLNIWVALLNLENLYGTQEALLKVFDEALRQNEPIDVFFKLVTIYQNSEKYELAEQLLQTMTKRFKDTDSVWTQYGLFLMKQGRPDAGRKILEKSLKAVHKKQHVNVIVKFSQYEFQYGDVERGKTMLESVLRNYPKRVDVWSVYIDLLIKQEDFNHVRELFERAIHLKLSSKRMKFFFKRYLTFEEQYGNEATVLAVKEKALSYVKSVT